MARIQKKPEVIIARGVKQEIVLDSFVSCVYRVKEGASLMLVGWSTQGFEDVQTIEVIHEGVDASSTMNFFILGEKGSRHTLMIRSIEQAPKSQSVIMIRTVVAESGKVDVQGLCRVEKSAIGSNTYFSHHALLLSPSAHARTIPSLEIETDDVSAGHAATVGQVDEDAYFYLITRGLSDAEARAVLVQGFLEKGLQEVPAHFRDTLAVPIHSFLKNNFSDVAA